MKNLIIHISGASGCGKTTLGNKLKDTFGKKITVKDLDDLRHEFIKSFYGAKKWTYINEEKYQEYIDTFIDKQKKPLIFVGLNDSYYTNFGKTKNLYFNLHSHYNYYIDIDDSLILKQKCLRTLNEIQTDKMAMNDLLNNNKKFIKMVVGAIKTRCNAKENTRINNRWKRDYKKRDYKFMSREGIFKNVSRILKGNVKISV